MSNSINVWVIPVEHLWLPLLEYRRKDIKCHYSNIHCLTLAKNIHSQGCHSISNGVAAILGFSWSPRSNYELTYHIWSVKPQSQWGELRTEQLFSGWSHKSSGFISMTVCGDRSMWPATLLAREIHNKSFHAAFKNKC